MQAHHRVLVSHLKKMGASDITLEHGKHSRLCFTLNGKSIKVVVASSPSCHRSFKNTLRDIRHMAGIVSC